MSRLITSILLCFVVFVCGCDNTSEANKTIVFQDKDLFEKGADTATVAAKNIESLLTNAIATGALTRDDLFDEHYVKISNTSPEKYHTKYDAFFDTELQNYLDNFLKDQQVVFAIAMDRNGYIPTHNTNYSERAKRIFKDPVSTAACQDTGPFHFVRYTALRDGKEKETLYFSAPIDVGGMRWGIFSISYQK